MTARDTICGHDREAMCWALSWCKPTHERWAVGVPSDWWPLYDAVTTDNVKLAAIITELVRLLGYKVGDLSDYSADIHVWPSAGLDAPPWPPTVNVAVAMGTDNQICNNLTITQARAMALFLFVRTGMVPVRPGEWGMGNGLIARGVKLALTADGTREQSERILRGEQ